MGALPWLGMAVLPSPDGGPGAQTRKPVHALLAKDAKTVNIYYLLNGNRAASSGFSDGYKREEKHIAPGAMLLSFSCFLLGEFIPRSLHPL